MILAASRCLIFTDRSPPPRAPLSSPPLLSPSARCALHGRVKAVFFFSIAASIVDRSITASRLSQCCSLGFGLSSPLGFSLPPRVLLRPPKPQRQLGGGQPGSSRIWVRVFSRHPLKFMCVAALSSRAVAQDARATRLRLPARSGTRIRQGYGRRHANGPPMFFLTPS